eukprot:12783459-Prorocentrum_lima.AAC.1
MDVEQEDNGEDKFQETPSWRVSICQTISATTQTMSSAVTSFTGVGQRMINLSPALEALSSVAIQTRPMSPSAQESAFGIIPPGTPQVTPCDCVSPAESSSDQDSAAYHVSREVSMNNKQWLPSDHCSSNELAMTVQSPGE